MVAYITGHIKKGNHFLLSKKDYSFILKTITFHSFDHKAFSEYGFGLRKCSSIYPGSINDDYQKGREIIRELFTTKIINLLCEAVENGLANEK